MRVEKICIQNFRGIEELKINLNPKFNLLIGDNGTGKTAILEALTVGIGAFFLGIPGTSSRNIRDEDIRYFKTIEGSSELAKKTHIFIEAIYNNEKIEWFKERKGITGKTLYPHNSFIKSISQGIDKKIKDPKRTEFLELPVLVYYSTSRLWKEVRENQKSEKSNVSNIPSRYRGYKDALQAKSTFSIMSDWFKSKFLSIATKGESSFQLECVKNVIIANISGATNVYWEFDNDKINALHVSFKNGTDLPFNYLSDGYRNLLAIFADLAWRCVTLNPHFKAEANLKSKGIALIDELDLHLHPKWQKTIVKQLKNTFPNIQFVTTTHSPFIIQETDEGELFNISEDGKISLSGANEYSLEDVAEYLQKVPDPAWSLNKKKMYDAAKEYFDLLNTLTSDKTSDELSQIREKLNILGKLYSDNVAYTAFLEQKRMVSEEKLNK